ncbi:MAG: sigma-70 family RNA polymerase sigma factor [Chloroflexi bacterium]|nr:sigma-70 family RNA polymerase sigma factor [Chloroflexota bacterium]
MTSERTEPAERPDAILGRRLVRNEPDALGGVYDLLSPTVWSMARRAFPQAVAEDVVQDVFMQVWTRRHQFDESRGSLAAWVLRIARNRITDTIRAASARPQLYPYEVDLDARQPADGEPAPWEHAWLTERRQKLCQAIQGLNQTEQDVLWLAYFGYTQSEISKRLDVPLGTVKTRTRAGLRKLRERLGDQDLLG